jgi:hypothetical protein
MDLSGSRQLLDILIVVQDEAMITTNIIKVENVIFIIILFLYFGWKNEIASFRSHKQS